MSGFFEVTINGELVHSKNKGEGFPDEKKVAAIVAKASCFLAVFLFFCFTVFVLQLFMALISFDVQIKSVM